MSNRIWASFVCCMLLCAGIALGEEEKDKAEEKGPKAGDLSIQVGVDIASAYYFRGYQYEQNGAIIQPYANLAVTVFTNDSLTITPYIGIWNSFHSKQTDASHSPRSLYETDYNVGVDFEMGEFTIGLIYNVYTSPSGAFGTTQELGISLTYDDTELMKKIGIPIALNPHIAWFWEIDDNSGTCDQYFEIGIEPSIEIGKTTFSVAFPVVAGFSPDGFYLSGSGHNSVCGYLSLGAVLSYPLPVPERYGTWTLKAGVTWINLFADSVKDSNGGDSWDVIGSVGLEFGL